MQIKYSVINICREKENTLLSFLYKITLAIPKSNPTPSDLSHGELFYICQFCYGFINNNYCFVDSAKELYKGLEPDTPPSGFPPTIGKPII